MQLQTSTGGLQSAVTARPISLFPAHQASESRRMGVRDRFGIADNVVAERPVPTKAFGAAPEIMPLANLCTSAHPTCALVQRYLGTRAHPYNLISI